MAQFRTAFEESLANMQSGADTTGAGIPRYIRSADTLNVANGNKSFLESAVDTIGSIPKFIGASIISGANQIYNVPTDIGNLLGGDFERSDTVDVVAAVDSDLGLFYQENREAVDLVGFMASSMIPGMAGVKVLNAGQRGLRGLIDGKRFGEAAGRSLGLLAPMKQTHLAKAIAEVSNSNTAAGILNTNALKAMGAGFTQNALEALAFETAVAATLFKSPILENQDFGDFAMNVAFGAGVFGIIGSAVDGAKISFSLKRAAAEADVAGRPWTSIAESAKASKEWEKLVLDYDQLGAMPEVPTNLSADRVAFLNTEGKKKVGTLNNNIRKSTSNIAGADEEVAQVLFDTFKAATPTDRQTAFLGLLHAGKMSDAVPAKVLDAAEISLRKLQKKVDSGKASVKEINDLAEMPLSNIHIGWAKTWGDNAGKVLDEDPLIYSLADTLKRGETLHISSRGVKAGKVNHQFDTNFNTGKGKNAKAWNVLDSTPLQAQARQIWARMCVRRLLQG